jgi:uncharacterized protein YceH (UPF0502 family)
MAAPLNEVEVRVLGCLIEKEMSTPEYYPLTLNALTNACNQKNNRDPVASFEEKDVVRALDTLRERLDLVRVLSGAEMRVRRYSHRFPEAFELSRAQVAVLCELMLRGPQTVGELRNRASRLHDMGDLAAVDAVLEQLAGRPAGALVERLPRQPGHKESRYAHLLGERPQLEAGQATPRPEKAALEAHAEDERLERLESEVEDLRAQMAALRDEWARFRQQFE